MEFNEGKKMGGINFLCNNYRKVSEAKVLIFSAHHISRNISTSCRLYIL